MNSNLLKPEPEDELAFVWPVKHKWHGRLKNRGLRPVVAPPRRGCDGKKNEYI